MKFPCSYFHPVPSGLSPLLYDLLSVESVALWPTLNLVGGRGGRHGFDQHKVKYETVVLCCFQHPTRPHHAFAPAPLARPPPFLSPSAQWASPFLLTTFGQKVQTKVMIQKGRSSHRVEPQLCDQGSTWLLALVINRVRQVMIENEDPSCLVPFSPS